MAGAAPSLRTVGALCLPPDRRLTSCGWSEDSSIDPKVAECLHISALFDRASEFDVIHNHFDFLPLTYAALVATPMVTTIHGFSSPRIVPVYAKYNHQASYVAISDAWVLNTWDAFLIPKPFSKALVRVSAKIQVPADADDLQMT